jgi:hypothetical protein
MLADTADELQAEPLPCLKALNAAYLEEPTDKRSLIVYAALALTADHAVECTAYGLAVHRLSDKRCPVGRHQ